MSTTSSADQPKLRLTVWGTVILLLVGLLLLGPAPLWAAEQLEVQLDGLKLPIDLVELQAWAATLLAAVGLAGMLDQVLHTFQHGPGG